MSTYNFCVHKRHSLLLEFVNERLRRDARQRGGCFTAINLRPPSACHTTQGGEETAAPSGTWHHNYIGSRTVCWLLEERKAAGWSHAWPLMCTGQVVIAWMWSSISDTVRKVR